MSWRGILRAVRPRRRRRPTTLRRRLTLLTTVAVGGAVVAVGVISYTVSRSNLLHNIDRSLTTDARGLANHNPYTALGFQGPGTGTPPAQPGYGGPGPGGDDRTQRFGDVSQIVTPAGAKQPITPGNQSVIVLPVDATDLAIAKAGSGTHVRSVTVSGKHYRLVTVGAGTYGALQHARDLADVDNTLSDLLLLLVITAAGGVVAAAAVGVLVTRSSLRPVRKVSDAAAEVARTQNLSALIPEVGPEEIAEIARSVNSMLVALETSRARQRELIDDTSHELRTPLTSLRTNIDVLLRLEGNANADLVLPPEERAQLLADVRSQMVELGDLVSQLVQLARAEAEPEPEVDVDVQAVVTRAVERARLRAPRATIRVSCAPALLLRGRPSMLERAVVNLLDNAVKFGPPDGTVTVAAVPGSITVADEGPGIAEGERARVFDRFYRSPRARALPGSGLGLAIVAEAAREHGGSTAVETAPAGGALIRVRLPGLADGAAADEPASASPQPARA